MALDYNTYRSDIRNITDYEEAAKAARNSTVVDRIEARRVFKQNNFLDDPLSLGYRPFFHYADTNGLLAPENYTNSALAYLKRIGENVRYEALKQFIRVLQTVNVDMSYMFQTIDGLFEAKSHFNKPIVTPEDLNFINFGMLESLDMRIQGLLQTYKMVSYDNIRHVWVLPRNLRQFSMSVVVYPIGAYFVTTQAEAAAIPNTVDVAVTGLSANDITKTNHIMFEFSQCEFDMINSGLGFFDSVNNQETMIANTSIAVSYRRVRESGIFHSLLGSTRLSGFSLSLQSIAKNIISNKPLVNFLANATSPVAQDILKLKDKFNSIESLAGGLKQMFGSATKFLERNAAEILTNQINRLYIGNVYDTSVSDLVALASSRSIENTIINLARNGSNTDRTRNTSGQERYEEPINVYK